MEKHLSASTVCVGPVLSTDKVNLSYIYNAAKPMKEMAPSKSSKQAEGP